jgi:transcriptional regulator with XRE-family HTH domain
MATLTPVVQDLLARIERDSKGSRNLYRAKRMAGLTKQLRDCADRRGLSIRALATAMETSPSQVQRLLSQSQPANITLDSILRAADAMGVELDLQLRDPQRGSYYVQRSQFPVVREMECYSQQTDQLDGSTEQEHAGGRAPVLSLCRGG